MWSGPLHDKEFVSKALAHVESNSDKYGTVGRMKGMLTVASEVLPYATSYEYPRLNFLQELDVPFYFTPSQIASVFHCTTPSLDDTAYVLHENATPTALILITYSSALLNAGHEVSRSHAIPGSLKTTATRPDIHDIFRSWVKKYPIKMDKLGEGSPARVLLSKEPRAEANFKHHPKSVSKSAAVKLVRYQQNPTPNWGPGSRAISGSKRKRPQTEE